MFPFDSKTLEQKFLLQSIQKPVRTSTAAAVSLVLLSACQTPWAPSHWCTQGFDTRATKTRGEKVWRSLAFGKDSFLQFWPFSVQDTCNILVMEALSGSVGWRSSSLTFQGKQGYCCTGSAVALLSQALKLSKDRGAFLSSCSCAASPS